MTYGAIALPMELQPGQWWFIHDGGTYAAVRPLAATHLRGPCKTVLDRRERHIVLYQDNYVGGTIEGISDRQWVQACSGFVVALGDADQHGSFQEFQNAILAARVKESVEGPANRRNTNDDSTGPGLGTFASVGTTGGHRGRKRSLLQGGIGVPFIAKWPGKIAAGRIDDTSPITAVDLLPIFCDIAGVELPQGYDPDGVSQLPALLGTTVPQRAKPIFWQWQTASSRGDNWPSLAIREGTWKLLLGKEANRVELFRFPDDRLENTNLYTEHPDQATV